MNIKGNKMNIKWKVLTAQVSAVTGAFAAGGALFGVIPGRPGLIVTAIAGGVNALLPHVQQAAGVLQAVKQFRADGKAQKVQKVEAVIEAVAERKVDDLLRTQGLVRTDKGLVPIDPAPGPADAGSGIADDSFPNVAGTGEEVAVPQKDTPAVLQQST